MTRRGFVAAACGAAGVLRAAAIDNSVLVHEHILVDFIGADRVSRERYNVDEVFRTALPKLKELRSRGCVRLQECTPNYLGRDPQLLQRLAKAAGLEIWTNTGLYAANKYKHLPPYVKDETAEALAKRWIAEAQNGVDGVKPRFIKIGVNPGPLPDIDKKLVQAAAIASRETGLTVASHTGNGVAALEQIEIIQPERFVWVHAQNETEHAVHRKVAEAGAWVEFDGISPKSITRHIEYVERMQAAGLLGRTLVSHDAGWYRVGEANGGEYRGYTQVYGEFAPRFDWQTMRTLLVENPRRAFGG